MSGKKHKETLSIQLPPLRINEAMLEELEHDRSEESAKTSHHRKMAAHVRWIIAKHLAEKKAKR